MTLTASIVTMSVFGAITMYIVSMLSLFKLRRSEPHMVRPFRSPCYPVFPAIALAGAVICLVTMIYYNPLIFSVFAGFLVVGYAFFLATASSRTGDAGDDMR